MGVYQEPENLPDCLPLQQSYSFDQAEYELKTLFMELWKDTIAKKEYDISASGMPWLQCDMDNLRRSAAFDGLVFFPGIKSDQDARYVYRMWRTGDKRGLYFLRSMLDIFIPGKYELAQQMQDKSFPYPEVLSDRIGDGFEDGKFLTSRIRIKIESQGITDLPAPQALFSLISASLPARMIANIVIDADTVETAMQVAMNINPILWVKLHTNVDGVNPVTVMNQQASLNINPSVWVTINTNVS